MRAERENSKKFAESFAGKANYDVLLENPDCGNLKTPQLGHALASVCLAKERSRNVRADPAVLRRLEDI